MLLVTLLLSISYLGEANPSTEWVQQYQAKFDQLDVVNFSIYSAHILHSITTEAAEHFFNINLPIDNGIPTVNTNISAPETEALVANIPSRSMGYASVGMNAFAGVMSNMGDPNWMFHGSVAAKLLHAFHMQDFWKGTRAVADNFDDISDDICSAALDYENNGIKEALAGIFVKSKNCGMCAYMEDPCEKNETKIQNMFLNPLSLTDNGTSWNFWIPEDPCPEGLRSAGLFIHCLGKKFQSGPVNRCSDSVTAGRKSYTKISTASAIKKCKGRCAYRRDNEPGSRYCLAMAKSCPKGAKGQKCRKRASILDALAPIYG